jgi:hypothetical protein
MDSLPMSDARGGHPAAVPPGKGMMIVKRVLIAASVGLCLIVTIPAPRTHAEMIPVLLVQEDPILDGDPEYPTRTAPSGPIAPGAQLEGTSNQDRRDVVLHPGLFWLALRTVWSVLWLNG